MAAGRLGELVGVAGGANDGRGSGGAVAGGGDAAVNFPSHGSWSLPHWFFGYTKCLLALQICKGRVPF